MRDSWSSIILLMAFCHVGLRSVSGQNYYYFHRTSHPSIFQQYPNANYQLPQPIPLQKYAIPAPAPLFNSPFTSASNFHSRSTYNNKNFQPPSNLNIIANSATFPHAYVPVKEYPPVPLQQNFFSQIPAQSYYPVYNSPVETYTQPQPQLTNFQVPPNIKPLRPLRPLAALPEYFRVPTPASTLNFGNAVFQQHSLNALPQYYQIKQLYAMKNEKPGVTGYSYSLGNNDQVTSTITVNFGSAKRYEPIASTPQKSVGLGVVSTHIKDETTGKSPYQIPSAEQGESQSNNAVLHNEEKKSETTDNGEAADADFGTVPLDQGELESKKDILRITGQDEPKDFPDLKSNDDETVPDVADAGLNETPEIPEEPVPSKGIDVMLQPPAIESTSAILNADNEDKNEEKTPLVESSADIDIGGSPELANVFPAEPNEANAQGHTTESSSSILFSGQRAEEGVEETPDIPPAEYDYFTDPDIAEKEVIELRSVDSKTPPKSQALESLAANADTKLTSDSTTTQNPSSGSTKIDSVIPENFGEAKEIVHDAEPEVDITTEPPQPQPAAGDISSDVDKEALIGNKNESSYSVTVTSTSGTSEPPLMTTISNRTIEIANRKVRVVIKRRVSRPARRTSFPLVLPLPKEF